MDEHGRINVERLATGFAKEAGGEIAVKDHDRSLALHAIPECERITGYAFKSKKLREDAMPSEIIESVGYMQESIEQLRRDVNIQGMEITRLRERLREREKAEIKLQEKSAR